MLNTLGRLQASVTKQRDRVDESRTMKFVRLCLLCVAVVLGGCSIFFEPPEPPSNPIPDLKQQRAIDLQIMKYAGSMKGAKALAISDAGPNEAQSGTEQWTTCARVEFSSQLLYYTFFVRAEKVIETRPAVINDKCETRTYRPAPLGSSLSIY